ncbi:MAG: NifB/NifX family molybdenum-iron cluster-binding protein [Desulfocapsa sp.]|nr:NifB/NifX family molybdenum-iron cluster-binding protein [Desulfocapsa sp.]
MLVAISATGNSLSSMVDPRFGRAPWFLIVDTDSKQLVEAIDNTTGKEAAHGAGIGAAALVADKGVKAVLTGKVGPKAMPVLDRAGVKAVNDVSGSVMEAIVRYSETMTMTPPPLEATQPSAPTPGQGQGRGGGQGCGCGQGKGQGKGLGQGRGGFRR